TPSSSTTWCATSRTVSTRSPGRSSSTTATSRVTARSPARTPAPTARRRREDARRACPATVTSAATRLVCLLGNPVAHSLSPQIHAAAFAACGIDAVYVACAVTAVPAAVTGLDALGALGANVTVPHKRAVWELVPRRTDEAELI